MLLEYLGKARRARKTLRRVRLEQLEPRLLLSGTRTDLFPPLVDPPGFAEGEADCPCAPEPPVNRAISLDPDVQQNPSIAVDPLDSDRLVVAYMDYALLETGFAGIGMGRSVDGGLTWQHNEISLPQDFDQGAANPVVQFDAQGRVFVTFMAATFLGEPSNLTSPEWWARGPGLQANNGVFVARSDDGGAPGASRWPWCLTFTRARTWTLRSFPIWPSTPLPSCPMDSPTHTMATST